MVRNMTPARLHKKETKVSPAIYLTKQAEAWVNAHAFLVLIVLLVVLMALFVLLVTALVGISATDSGMTYNAMERII